MFCFADLFALARFAILVPAQRLNTIEALAVLYDVSWPEYSHRLEYQAEWVKICRLLSSMKSLKRLEVRFPQLPVEGGRPRTCDPVRALSYIRHVERFEVVVNSTEGFPTADNYVVVED